MSDTSHLVKETETSLSEIKQLFELQQQSLFDIGNRSVKERIAILKKFLNSILAHRNEIKEALYNDFKKHPSEVDMTEIYPVTSEIKHTIKNITEWCADKQVKTPLALAGSTSYIKQESKGVVLIVAPWNFPINLTFAPLVLAIAAGNSVILKPSEHTPHAARIMKKIVNEVFEEKHVSLVEGGIQTSKDLLSLPFNHIFFTGAPAIGKIVMKAASKHLSSVTLELGGKSPTIIDESANLDLAARRIALGKFANNGQICIAPDYVLIHKSKHDAFVKKLSEYLVSYYTTDASDSESYARMVNKKHFERVVAYLKDAQDKGATISYGGNTNAKDNYIDPTIVTNPPNDSLLMTEEIFGPILPIITFDNIKESIAFINGKEKPLALYIYSSNKKNIKEVLNNTRAGGTCINHNAIHFYNVNLPFGGSNNSGIGKSHGWLGFQEFSNSRGILKQNIPNALDILTPPFTAFKQKLIDFTVKWL